MNRRLHRNRLCDPTLRFVLSEIRKGADVASIIEKNELNGQIDIKQYIYSAARNLPERTRRWPQKFDEFCRVGDMERRGYSDCWDTRASRDRCRCIGAYVLLFSTKQLSCGLSESVVIIGIADRIAKFWRSASCNNRMKNLIALDNTSITALDDYHNWWKCI